MLEAYLDESGTHADSPLVCVAGFLFSRSSAKDFCKQWEHRVKGLLPDTADVFHATECVGRHGKFFGISRQRSERIVDTLVAIIKNTVAYGVVVGVDQSEYREEIDRQPQLGPIIGSAYALCALRCSEYVGAWLKGQGISSDVKYVFESGYQHSRKIAYLFSLIGKNEELRERHQLRSYNDDNKMGALPLQAADLLAWEWQRAYGTAMVAENRDREWRRTLAKLAGIPIQAELISATGMGIKAMVNQFYGLQAKWADDSL